MELTNETTEITRRHFWACPGFGGHLTQWDPWRTTLAPAASSVMGWLLHLLGKISLLIAMIWLPLVGVRVIVPPISSEMKPAPARKISESAQDLRVQIGTVVSVEGLRVLAGDVLWLRTHRAWVRGDLAATQVRLNLAVEANPRALAFWLNGARMLAYDMREWRIARAGRGVASTATWRRITREQADQAFAWLDRAGRFHPRAPEIFVERALIQLYCLGDSAAAAENFRLAAERPRAPGYAARLQLVLLQRLSRISSARPWPGASAWAGLSSGAGKRI